MRCNTCGAPNADDAKFCTTCGVLFEEEKIKTPERSITTYAKREDENTRRTVECPKCGSNQIQFITITQGSDYDAGTGCCGLILFGPLGLLCGLLNQKKTAVVRKCMRCGNEF